MSINTSYYGTESTWQNIKPDNNLSTDFKVPCFYDTVNSTYGIGSKSWISGKFAVTPESYGTGIDKTCCWCVTDGTAPFDKILYATGFNANHIRYTPFFETKNSIGLNGYTNSTPYITTQNCTYYKTSVSGTTYNNVPLSQKKYSGDGYITPNTFTDTNIYTRVANSRIIPYLKFNFKDIFYVPIIHFYVLKTAYSVNDFRHADITNIPQMIDFDLYSDLYTLKTNLENNIYPLNKVIIISIYCCTQNIKWGSTEIDSQTSGTSSSNMATITNLAIANDTLKFDFDEWYTSQNPEIMHADFDMTLINNKVKTGTTTATVYNERSNTSQNVTISGLVLKCLCGMPDTTGTGYYTPPENCYQIDTAHLDFDNFEGVFRDDRHQTITVFMDLTNISSFVEYVRKTFAYLGGYFSDCYYPNWTTSHTETSCYLGIIDDNGVTHGEYSHGIENTLQKNYNWNDDVFEKTPYDPNKPPPTDENDKGDLTTHLNSGYYETSAIYYATTETQIRKFIDFMNTYSPSDADLISDFKGVNPADYITSCLYFPFNVMYSGANSPIYLSVLNTTATGLKFSSTYGITYVDFGSIFIERYFNDFRDFAPYTKLSVDIPFSSTVDLDISEFYNHYLNIKMCIDFTTGDTITLISRDGLVVKTVTGTCAVQLPISALSMATYQDTINSLQTNAKIIEEQKTANDASTLINTGVGIAAGVVTDGFSTTMLNPATTVIGGATQRDILIEQGKRNEYSLSHATPSPIKISGGTPNGMMMLEYVPRYTITRCKTLNNINYDVFGKTTGYATVQQGIVSDFSGFIVCSDVEFNSISATSTEQDMIKNLLKSGVVV